ncbi:hypothetical protein [Tateyamaria sp. ANG-S1]|uniref:hypothetical protein n=1 Tax=Tateyamaria sp. ANG-S1 TaxID=1577905 RepID=UPI00057FE687|nr:hypothetical protein [Tateyamaria sp. ANG-S1]KIC45470.1 hypothetical protein RA29_20750 [Tateyamaria sp. ANG-S1]
MIAFLIGTSIGVGFIATTAAVATGAGIWLALLAYVLGSIFGMMFAILWAWSRDVQASAHSRTARLKTARAFHAKDIARTNAAEH